MLTKMVPCLRLAYIIIFGVGGFTKGFEQKKKKAIKKKICNVVERKTRVIQDFTCSTVHYSIACLRELESEGGDCVTVGSQLTS